MAAAAAGGNLRLQRIVRLPIYNGKVAQKLFYIRIKVNASLNFDFLIEIDPIVKLNFIIQMHGITLPPQTGR